MKRKQKNIMFFLLIISIIFILIAFVLEKRKNKENSDNIYNIGNYEDINSDINTKAIAFFEEYVLENFSNIEVNTDNFKVYRADSVIESTNNFNATEKAKRLNNLYKHKNIKDINNDKNSLMDQKKKINSNNIYDLDVDYFNGINDSTDFSNTTYSYINNYINNKSVKLKSSGYLLNFYDGYESLITSNTIKDINWDYLTKSLNNNSVKMSGLKYVDNKHYFVASYLDNLYDLDKLNLNSVLLSVNNNKLRANLYDFNTYKNGYIVIFKLYDGIENFLENRFIDLSINFETKQGFLIPKEAIIDKNGVKGVYYLEGNIVKFSPVLELKEKDNKVYISTDLNEIFPNALDTYKSKFNKLKPFSKILLKPKNFEEGKVY